MNNIIHIIQHTARTATVLLLALLTTATAWSSSFSGGSGTKADPYKISSSADLVQLATDINNSTSRLYEDQYFVQTGNINMSGINFVPIGINDNFYHQFRGKYNGQNYTISNLTVNGSYDYAGLFGYIYNGDIDNVRLVSPSITNTKTSYTSALVGFGNMPGIHNCLVISPTLSGGNSIGVFAGGQKAGNIKYTYYTGNNNYSNVGDTDGSNANTSIGHAYTLTLSGGATTSTTAAFTYNSTDYYAGTITLSNAAPAGWIYAYTVNGSPIDGTSFTISADATVALSRTPDPTHFSDNGDGSYTIKTATGWNVFCDLLADNTMGYFSDKTVQLGDDITVTRMAGSTGHEFAGTFDGQGKTLFVNITGTVQGTAPFCEIKGATIRNLVVTGSVAGMRHSAGLVGFARGDDASVENTIENCLVATDVSIKDDDKGYLGGIVGHGLQCKLTIRGCAFTGSLTSESYYTGGLQGWSDGNTLILEDDIFAASSVNAANVGFHPIAFHNNNKTTTATVSNVYYTIAPTCTTSTRIAAAGKQAHTVAAGENVTIGGIALTGTATQYTVSGITAYSGGGLQRGQTLYYGSDDQLSLTLSNSATGAPLGYQYGYTASAGTLSGTTLTMPDENVTISVNTAGALLSTRQPVTVAYINEYGTTDEASAIALDGHETVDGDGDVCLDEGTYYVGTDITYANQIYLNGDVTLILADGKTMTLNGDTPGIINDSRNLTIYGQSLDDDAGTLRYNGTADGITVNNYEQHSGNVSITTTGSTIDSWVWGIDANDVTLRGGTLTVTANSTNAIAIMSGTHSILGGRLDANATGTDATGIYASADDGTAITLGWTRPADRITASSISAPYGGTVAVADGQALTDGSGHIYTGTLSASVLSGFAAETTLQPCLALADAADNNAAITAHAGKTLAVALSGRTLYKDGSWNTLCLPFSVTTASGTLSGDNVQAMTLNTTTSNFADGTLTLNFTAATTIPAGTPFIIKWDESGTDITNPVFDGVTVSNATNDATIEGVLTFTGTYAPVTIPAEGDKTKLYLGSGNKLYYPNAAMTIGCHRAYFQLLGDLTAGEPVGTEGSGQHVRAFNLNFGDDEATGIISVHDSGFTVNGSDAWYTIDGRKLDGQPTAKGLYIHGGRKVAIK